VRDGNGDVGGVKAFDVAETLPDHFLHFGPIV
jgi:hypothetical protein